MGGAVLGKRAEPREVRGEQGLGVVSSNLLAL